MSKELWEALFMGVLQGLTEFLPVSSSGHLQAMKALGGSPLLEDLTLDVLLHMATLLAVILVFRSDFKRLLGGLFQGGEGRRWCWLVVVGAIPGGLAGLLAKDWIEHLGARLPWLLPVCWLGTALALVSLRWIDREPGTRAMTIRAALWVGCWQAVALLPGVSRSGITIVAALWLGRRRDEAATFSFLIATPLILGATLLTGIELAGSESSHRPSWGAILVGGLAAFVTGWAALRLLLRMLHRGALHRWAFYLIPLAIAYGSWLLFA